MRRTKRADTRIMALLCAFFGHRTQRQAYASTKLKITVYQCPCGERGTVFVVGREQSTTTSKWLH